MAIETSSPSVDIDVLTAEIAALSSNERITAVAIAGPPGSGKSTLASALATRIGASCSVVPMDGFHLDNTILQERGLLHVKGAPETFDREGFEALVHAIKEGRTKQFPTFDRDLDSVIKNGGSLPDEANIVIFEGNYLLFDEAGWADLTKIWDASIWLDVPVDVLERRLISRWLDQGMPEKEAKERAQENDLANARRIMDNALPATWVMRN